MDNNKYMYRYLARIVIEAETPLVVGSGDKDITTDALVATDVNGLPYIPGTAIAGVVRHAFDAIEREPDQESFKEKKDKDKESAFFGYQIFGKSKDSRGSEIIFSEAKMIGKEGKAIDGLQTIDKEDAFYKHFKALPIRQHVRISEKGVAEDAGKFDEQIVYKGTRFCFEIEMDSDGTKLAQFIKALSFLQSDSFRIGSGTRSGFGKINIVSCKVKYLDLNKEEDRCFYLDKSSSLAEEWDGDDFNPNKIDAGWTKYELTLRPQDFFLFGSGFGDDDADMTPVREDVIIWNDEGKPAFEKECILIPSTSVKGALAHRTAYHYNKLTPVYADHLSPNEIKQYVGSNNVAVQALFGLEGEKDIDNKMNHQKRGNVIFSDIIEKSKNEDKILNHVAIDRFTGGAIDSALFTEKVVNGKGKVFTTTIMVNNKAFKEDKEGKVKKSFEAALTDLCSGMLPLGGGVNRGNGVFEGTIKKNDEQFYPEGE